MLVNKYATRRVCLCVRMACAELGAHIAQERQASVVGIVVAVAVAVIQASSTYTCVCVRLHLRHTRVRFTFACTRIKCEQTRTQCSTNNTHVLCNHATADEATRGDANVRPSCKTCLMIFKYKMKPLAHYMLCTRVRTETRKHEAKSRSTGDAYSCDIAYA